MNEIYAGPNRCMICGCEYGEHFEPCESGKPVEEFPPLEVKCSQCDGHGCIQDLSGYYGCAKCCGGYELTEFGKAVKAMLKRRLPSMLRIET